ncbi:hypothetical protein SDC9_184032 [bioreactor metagenome]|uniref:Flagellar basal-body/hook protein C-terminal domain-containing protein n=1 Tax=bioreactor metagenome TaxID=1076179 RepID=A0A645HLL3_9ZZZZ
MQTLDKYTVTFADKVNSLLAKGYGVNDLTGAAPGRVLFTAKSGNITAGSIEVSDSIKTAADLPLSDKANSPGNAAIGLEIARILQDGSFLQGQTPVEFYSNFIGRISQNANEALNAKKSSQLVVEQLNSTRSSTMGVNMNEEAISLIKFQKNLEAASKIIATNNQVLATIINLGK